MIESEALRLSHIVDQILLAGQLDADAVELRLTECNPAELAAGVIESASVHLPDGISLNLVSDGAADHVRRQQAAPGARQPRGQRDQVLAGRRRGRDQDRRRTTASCEIVVSDEGLGIPTSERERIFEKFYRLDPQQTSGVGGSGLGLYICRELVERMDGQLGVESEPGVGSRFTVSLPAR